MTTETRAQTGELVERAMDAYLLNSDLGGASPQAGDQIAGLVWSHIEQVIEEGVFAEVDQIVEEASFRADAEVDQILSEDRVMSEELIDTEEEDCDA